MEGKDIRHDYQPGHGPMRGLVVALALSGVGMAVGLVLVAALKAVW